MTAAPTADTVPTGVIRKLIGHDPTPTSGEEWVRKHGAAPEIEDARVIEDPA